MQQTQPWMMAGGPRGYAAHTDWKTTAEETE